MTGSGPVARSADPVAIFGGPYSSLKATRAFFDEMARRSISPDRIVCTGDIIAYGADAAATLALVRASGCQVVMSNVEENLAAGAANCGCGLQEGSTCEDQIDRLLSQRSLQCAGSLALKKATTAGLNSRWNAARSNPAGSRQISGATAASDGVHGARNAKWPAFGTT